MESILSEIEAQSILQPHFITLSKIMNESLEDLNKALGTLTEQANNRAKSALLHSISIEKAKKYFDKVSDIVIKSKYQSIQIIFSNKIVGRIKKVNKDNISANAKTKRNEAILKQQMTLFGDLYMADIAPTTFVDLGYNINETGSEFDKLNIICRNNKTIDWVFSFKGNSEAIALSDKQTDALFINEETQIKIKKAK